jgi:hypothetical protein
MVKGLGEGNSKRRTHVQSRPVQGIAKHLARTGNASWRFFDARRQPVRIEGDQGLK